MIVESLGVTVNTRVARGWRQMLQRIVAKGDDVVMRTRHAPPTPVH
jgi:hypothetical protein